MSRISGLFSRRTDRNLRQGAAAGLPEDGQVPQGVRPAGQATGNGQGKAQKIRLSPKPQSPLPQRFSGGQLHRQMGGAPGGLRGGAEGGAEMERQVLPAPVKVQIKGPNLGAKGFCQSDSGLVYPFSPNR